MPPRRAVRTGLLLFLAYKGLWRSPSAFLMLVLAVAAGESFQIPNTANLAGYDAELLVQGVSKGAGDVRVRPRFGAALHRRRRARRAHRQGRRRARGGASLDLARRDRHGRPVDLHADRRHRRGRGARPVSHLRRRPAHTRSARRDPRRRSPRIAAGARGRRRDRRARDPRHGGDAARLALCERTSSSSLQPARAASGAYVMAMRGVIRGAFLADDVAFVDRRFLTSEVGVSGAASTIHVYTDAPADAARIARTLEATFPEVEARGWMEDSRFLGAAIQANRALNGISSAMAMIGVAIPVWALLFVSVAQRRREIGLYGALGFGASQVFAIFLLQALVVGVLGVALGVLGGYGIVRWFFVHPLFQNDSFVIRPVLSGAALLRSVATILGTTLVAGVYPALRAARTDPARALRGLV